MSYIPISAMAYEFNDLNAIGLANLIFSNHFNLLDNNDLSVSSQTFLVFTKHRVLIYLYSLPVGHKY